jgi:hypothetical protein
MMVEIDDVERFLKRFKEKLKFWDIVFLDDRGKNVQTLADLELRPNYRKKVIEELEIMDYSQGPLPENWFGSHEMWVFGRQVKGSEIYIKITLGVEGSGTICISFHKAEFPMKYPFKNERR